MNLVLELEIHWNYDICVWYVQTTWFHFG